MNTGKNEAIVLGLSLVGIGSFILTCVSPRYKNLDITISCGILTLMILGFWVNYILKVSRRSKK